MQSSPPPTADNAPTTKFRILTVCTGNICRSPAVERLLAQRLGPQVEVSSAGTQADVGAAIHPQMASLLPASQETDDPFTATQLRADHVAQANLVLALTRKHRSRVVRLHPAALNRCFTLLEFARIVSSPEFPGVDCEKYLPERLRQATRLAAAHRWAGTVVSDDDVPDPYGHGPGEYEHAHDLINTAVESIATAVGAGSTDHW